MPTTLAGLKAAVGIGDQKFATTIPNSRRFTWLMYERQGVNLFSSSATQCMATVKSRSLEDTCRSVSQSCG